MRLGRKNAQSKAILHCRAAVRIYPSKMDGVVPMGCNSQLNWVKKVILFLSQDFLALFSPSLVTRSSLVKQYIFYHFFCSKETRKIRKASGLKSTFPQLLASGDLDDLNKKVKQFPHSNFLSNNQQQQSIIFTTHQFSGSSLVHWEKNLQTPKSRMQ